MRSNSLFTFTFFAAVAFLDVAVRAANNSGSATLGVTNAALKNTSSSQTSSEDAVIKNLHWLGLINGQINILRCACPVMDVAEHVKAGKPAEEDLKMARERMQHLRNLGICTVISFQHQDPTVANETNVEHIAVALEQIAAKEVGLAYVVYPMSNKGKDSFEDMSDEAVIRLLDPISEDIFKFAKTGGVAFHCKSGKDRTGIMAGYLRLKYQHWKVDEVIAEMRRNGHIWKNFAKAGATNSWHENHLRAIAKTLHPPAP